MQKSHPENQVEVFKINVQLRIYVYITLPSRRECSDDERQINIQYLIEDFKSRNHDDVNDPEVLSLCKHNFYEKNVVYISLNVLLIL